MRLLQENTIIMTVQLNELDSTTNDYTGFCEVLCFDVTDDAEIQDNSHDNAALVNIVKKWFEDSFFYKKFSNLKLWDYEISFKIF